MSRYLYNQIVLAAIESTAGTLAAMTLSNGLLLKNVTVKLADEGDSRDLLRGYMGNSDILSGNRRMELSFTTELASSGTAGTAPAWGILARACGLLEVVTAAVRVEYTPLSTALESVSFGFRNDGVNYTARFGRGTLKVNFSPYKAPTIDWTFKAIDTTSAAAAQPASTFATWIRPQVVSDANTSSLKVGGSYAAGAITGGAALIWENHMVDLGNSVDHVLLVGAAEAVDISARDIKGSVSAFLTAAEEVQWRADWLANTMFSYSLQHGTGAGNKIILHGANVQKTNVQPGNSQTGKRLMTSADLQYVPTGAGSNDMILVAL